MDLNCRPGDFAIFVLAENLPNVGLIVRRRKRGPVPTSYLRAIRGLNPTEERFELGVIQDSPLDE